jgi:hypothetical protein
MELYPKAKVVLVRRDPDKWWQNMKGVLDHFYNPLIPVLSISSPVFGQAMVHMYALEVPIMLEDM